MMVVKRARGIFPCLFLREVTPCLLNLGPLLKFKSGKIFFFFFFYCDFPLFIDKIVFNPIRFVFSVKSVLILLYLSLIFFKVRLLVVLR